MVVLGRGMNLERKEEITGVVCLSVREGGDTAEREGGREREGEGEGELNSECTLVVGSEGRREEERSIYDLPNHPSSQRAYSYTNIWLAYDITSMTITLLYKLWLT